MNNKVHILPAEIISKIAAGEVIERPASVLKELIENSIDANATSIEVIVKDAGKNLIQIKDNGSGISQDDLDVIFNRHATSKIQTIDDLYNIDSLGFRGEALYSISAVSDVILCSKTKNQDSGWELHLRGQEKIHKKPVGIQPGTEIQIKELFFNTPARKKFLKSNTSELNHILNIFIPYTLLYPQIKFSLTHENKKNIDLNPTQDLKERISDSLNLEKKYLLEDTKEFPQENLSIKLILGDINIQRTRKDMQFIFINNRPVENKALSFHINEVYKLLFSHGVYPFFCCFIKLPAENLDVNVHPTKREVKIKNESSIASIIRNFSEHLLMTQSKPKQANSFNYNTNNSKTSATPITNLKSKSSYEIIQKNQTQNFTADAKIQTHTQLDFNQSLPIFNSQEIILPTSTQKTDLKEKLKIARYLGNLLKKYLLFETDTSLLIIDQHAAQERITFEKLKTQFDNHTVEIQNLLSPITINLSKQELNLWEENKITIEEMGFDCSLFDKQTLAIHSHPILITDPQTSVRNLLNGESISKLDHQTLSRMACRSSVMTGFSMNKEQAEFQRKGLIDCNDPFTCPHGRPTVIEIEEEKLRKEFLRK